MPRLPEGRSPGLALVYKQSACSFGPALLSLEWLGIQGFLKHKREKSTFWRRAHPGSHYASPKTTACSRDSKW
jgi:hypothetical protein